MKRIYVLPNLLTLGNAFCGLLAMAKAVDALAYAGAGAELFYARMETACMLVFVAMLFDVLDGAVARATQSFSAFGAQLDSFADAITFGVAPALLAKVLIEHEGPRFGYEGSPRLHFLAAAAFALMAVLRLARFNLEDDSEKTRHAEFRGLPSPAAAGTVASTIWLYLILRRPQLEVSDGSVTPFGRLMEWMYQVDWGPALDWVPPLLVLMLPALGFLMVSRVRYVHATAWLARERAPFTTLVGVVGVGLLFFLAPVPFLFLFAITFVSNGVLRTLAPGLFRRRSGGRARAV